MDSAGLKVQDEVHLVETIKERIRDITEASDGQIYFSTNSGEIYSLIYTP